MMKAPQFRNLRLADLANAKHNPTHRTDPARLRTLVQSVSESGLIYPILVSPARVSGRYTIIDGHRRAAACRELGMETIAAFLTEADPNSTYAAVNCTAQRMGGNDALCVWLSQPDAVSALQRRRFEHMNDVLGPKRLTKIAREGFSLKLFNSAMQVVRYCAVENEEVFVQKVVDWMLEHRTSGVIKQAMAAGQSAKIILSAIKLDKPLTMRLTIRE